MSNHEVESKIRQLRELQRLIEEAQDEADGIKDEIKAFMGDEEEIIVGEYKVTWKNVQSTRFDSAAFKKAMPEIYQAFTKESISRRFNVV